MPKIVFNEFPKTRQPFPFEKYDFELDLSELKLSSQVYKYGFSYVASLGIDINSVHVPIAQINFITQVHFITLKRLLKVLKFY